MKKLLILSLFLLLSSASLRADVPIREEQLIYSILAFNGKDYAGTFSGEDSDTIYLIADVDNVLTVRKTLVYFWPITQELKIDTEALDQVFNGTLELYARGMQGKKIEMVDYTYYNIQGEYELNWNVATGEEAHTICTRYSETIEAYWQALADYQQQQAAFEMLVNQITLKSNELKETGKDKEASILLEHLQTLEPPVEPKSPTKYIIPPVPVQEGFFVNLPPGEYHIRFVNVDGTVMEGSERRVITFKKRRENMAGLEIIPGAKWSRPVESKTPSSVLYVNGTTDLYLRPFFQDEYNDLYYEKMRKNDSRGNPNIMKWVRIQQVPQARIIVDRPQGKREIIHENAFVVEQAKGSSLGYTIVPYIPKGAHKDREPNLRAFHLPLNTQSGVIHLMVQDKNRNTLPGSERQIRIVASSRKDIMLLSISLTPVLVMIVVVTTRRRKYTH
jgi:hypothetical protein